MSEPLTFFPAYQARRRVQIQREYVERFKAAETQHANPIPASIPPARRLRRAGVLMAAAGGFFVLSWVFLLIAITSLVTYYPRLAYYRLMGK